MVYNFLCKDEKTRRNIYLLLLKTSVWKEVRHFFRTVYPNRNLVTTHPDLVSHEMVTLSQTEIVFSATNILSAILFHEIRLTDKML